MSDTSVVYSSHAFLHPGVPLAAALVLLADELSGCDVSELTAHSACESAGLQTWGDLLRDGVVGSLRLRRRHKKVLRRAIDSWKRRHMRAPTRPEIAALYRLAKDEAACRQEVARGASEKSLVEALMFKNAGRGASVLDLQSDGRKPGLAKGLQQPLGLSLLRTALEHGNPTMVRLLSEHVTADALFAAGQPADLPLLTAGPLLDALLETMRAPAALLGYAVRHWTASAVEVLLRRGLPAHHSHLSSAIGRDRDGLVDLFLPGGRRPPVAPPPLAFGCVKAALDARRADLVLRLLRAGAPAHGAPNDHRVVDRLVALWHEWLCAAGVDAAARMREGRALAVHNKQLPAGSRLAAHRAAGLRLEPVHAVLWERYAAGDAHAAHVHCSLPMVRAVAPWVGADWCDGGSAAVHRLFPRDSFDAALRALLLVAARSGAADSLWVGLVGRKLAAQGQPPNLEAMRRREAEEQRGREYRQRVEEASQHM